MTQVFVYGTLQDDDILGTVLDGNLPACHPARLSGYRLTRALEGSYPVLVPAPDDAAHGLLLTDLSVSAIDRLAYFEAAFGYHLTEHQIETETGPRMAGVFASSNAPEGSTGAWELSSWQNSGLPVFLEIATELMGHYDPRSGRPAAAIYAGVFRRSLARRQAAAADIPQSFRHNAQLDAVTLDQREALYTGFFAMERLTYVHPRFDGGIQAGITREVFLSGDAVSVLPWDPVTDTVLLIEQLRSGPVARQDPAPWLVEPIAGICDHDETIEAAARREAVEEAGLDLGEMVKLAEYYSSPGATSEYLTGFVARADLSGAGGLFGLDNEGEDIRAMVVPLETALAAIDTGEIRTGPLVILLLALARRRAALLQTPGFAVEGATTAH